MSSHRELITLILPPTIPLREFARDVSETISRRDAWRTAVCRFAESMCLHMTNSLSRFCRPGRRKRKVIAPSYERSNLGHVRVQLRVASHDADSGSFIFGLIVLVTDNVPRVGTLRRHGRVESVGEASARGAYETDEAGGMILIGICHIEAYLLVIIPILI